MVKKVVTSCQHLEITMSLFVWNLQFFCPHKTNHVVMTKWDEIQCFLAGGCVVYNWHLSFPLGFLCCFGVLCGRHFDDAIDIWAVALDFCVALEYFVVVILMRFFLWDVRTGPWSQWQIINHYKFSLCVFFGINYTTHIFQYQIINQFLSMK